MSSALAASFFALVAALPTSLTLDEALELAKTHQPSVSLAKANADASSARAREAYAPLLPSLSSGLSYSRQTANFVPRPGAIPSSVASASTVSLNSSDFWSANVSAQWTAWDFGQTRSRYAAALSAEQSQLAQVHAAEVAGAFAVRTTFFAALAQRDLVSVAEATLANTQAHYAQVEAFVKVGTRPEIDLAQSKSDRANARLLVLNAKNTYALARAKLNQVMGVEGPSNYELAGPQPAPLDGEDGSLDQLLKEALDARPEVAALARQLEAQQQTLQSIQGAYWPTLGLSLGATLGATQLDKVVPNLNGQVAISWPFYQGGLTTAQEREARAALVALDAQVTALRLQVRLEVEQASLALAAARETVEVSEEARLAAAERLALAEGRYNAGAGSSLELGDAQVAFTGAAAQKVQAVANLAAARAQLQAALGRR